MSSSEEEIHLRDYLKVINKRRGTIVTFFVFVLLLDIVITFSMTPLYRGETKIMLEKVSSNSLVEQTSYSLFDPEFYETQFQLIRSLPVARGVVDQLDLVNKYDSYLGGNRDEDGFVSRIKSSLKSFRDTVKSLFGVKEVSTASRDSARDRLARKILRKIKVAPVKNSRIVAIQYDSPAAEFSALVADSIAKAYLAHTLNLKMESTRRTLDWMVKKSQEEAQKLEQAEIALQKYVREKDIVTLENKVTVTPQKIREITSELVKVESKRKELEALQAQIDALRTNPEAISAVSSDDTLKALTSQILKVDQQILEYSNKYGPKHPVMIKVKGDLAILKKKKQQQIEQIISSIDNELTLARTAEESLKKQLWDEKQAALNINEKFIQYGALKRNVDTSRQLYDALLLKLKEQSITQETQAVNLWIVEESRVQPKPAKPKKMLNILLGVVMGLFGGVALAFFIEYLDNTVKEPQSVEDRLQIPVLGVVAHDPTGVAVERCSLTDERSIFAENYRALRTSILLSSAEEAPKRILITSASPGEGKTTTAFNLAMVMARSGKKVLLVDADLRKPRLHKLLKISNKSGVSSYLARTSSEEIMHRGPHPNLSVVTAGPISPNPSELLSSRRVHTFFELAEKEFDMVICDSAPILAVTDTVILTRYFSAVVIVLRARKTTFEMAQRALKALRDVKAGVLGIVINGLHQGKDGYYYNEYYSYAEDENEES